MAVPVSLPDAKRQLRYYDEDLTPEREAEITGFIADAAAWVERYTGHILEARDVTEEFTGFDRLCLRAWPVNPAAVPIITYADADNQAVSVTPVRLNLSSRPARVAPWTGSRWPSVSCGTAVTVTVRAGYEDDAAVPANLRRAMLILISAYDADREGGDLFTKAEAAARGLCRDLRARSL